MRLEEEKFYLAGLSVVKQDKEAVGGKQLFKDPDALLVPLWDEDDVNILLETDDQKLTKRTTEILQAVRIIIVCLY